MLLRIIQLANWKRTERPLITGTVSTHSLARLAHN